MSPDTAADLDRRIAATRAEISRLRDAGRMSGDGPVLAALLAVLAKLNAKRTRLMFHGPVGHRTRRAKADAR